MCDRCNTDNIIETVISENFKICHNCLVEILSEISVTNNFRIELLCKIANATIDDIDRDKIIGKSLKVLGGLL